MASFANKEQPSPLYWQREVSCVPFSIHHPSNKSAKNLDMCGICVNTHTHTHSHLTLVARVNIPYYYIYARAETLYSGVFRPFLLFPAALGRGGENEEQENEE